MLLDQWSLLVEENADWVPTGAQGYVWGVPQVDPPAPPLHVGAISLPVAFRGSWRIIPAPATPLLDVESRRRADDEDVLALLGLLMDKDL